MSQNHCGCQEKKVISLPFAGFGLNFDVSHLPDFVTPEDLTGYIRKEDVEAMIAKELAGYIKKEDADALLAKEHLCEFYLWRHPTLKPGYQPAHGGVLENAAQMYPEAWAYLQTEEGAKLCVSEEEWQAMTTAVWATLADGTQVGWDGIGGAPYYVQDLENGTLRLPDLRGMYAEASGFDGLGVGGVHGDGIRKITGDTGPSGASGLVVSPSGAFAVGAGPRAGWGAYGIGFYQLALNVSRVVPTANKNQPRAWGALACVYLGVPR